MELKKHTILLEEKSSFAKAIEAVKIAKANNIPVLVNTTIKSANLDNIPEMNKLMKELNVNWLEAYVEHDVIKKWQQGTNLSRPTNELFKVVEETR